MKIYLLDCGWVGVVIVTAHSKEEAIEKIKKHEYMCQGMDLDKVEEHSIEGFDYECNNG